MASRTLFLAALAVASYVDASWLPWMPQQQARDLKVGEVPNNDFNIHHFNSSTICLRLSTSISIEVQYETTDDQGGMLQVIVPHLTNENVNGSCGPDAFLDLSWGPEAVDSGDSSSLHFDFMQQNDSYFLANIQGVINIADVPEDFPPNSAAVELSVTDQILFEAPLGIVSMCYGTTVLQADFVGSVTAVNITMTDVQLLAYWEESYWPEEVKSCNPSSAAPKVDNVVAFVLGTVGTLLVNTILW